MARKESDANKDDVTTRSDDEESNATPRSENGEVKTPRSEHSESSGDRTLNVERKDKVHHLPMFSVVAADTRGMMIQPTWAAKASPRRETAPKEDNMLLGRSRGESIAVLCDKLV